MSHIDINSLNIQLSEQKIHLIRLREHSKASEKYVDIKIIRSDDSVWEGSIPYYYRRTGVFIHNNSELYDYLIKIKHYFEKDTIENFINKENEYWNTEMSGKETTKSFFDVLLNMRWNSVFNDLPNNPNWARRIQDIKEFGYTLATDTNKTDSSGKKTSHILLLPIPKEHVTGYEVINDTLKKRILKILNHFNSFESRTIKHGLIPDHKFPEIRWDSDTKSPNDNLLDDDIKQKFQLLDNQRNLQKREICRKCFQTNERGIIFGIEYFYSGNREWDKNIPKTGKLAEKGCIGCGWYDIDTWREKLNQLIK